MKIGALLLCVLSLSCCKDKSVPNSIAPKPVVIQEAITKKELVMQDTFGTNYIMGKFDPETHESFALIPAKYADRQGLYLRKEVLDQYIKMYQAAYKAGINLTIRSATRNFEYQKGIWERKWTGATTLSDGTNLGQIALSPVEKARKILLYSSMPGTSRHHWGTDFDLNAFNNEYFAEGKGLEEYNWLQQNASKFGFAQVYTPIDTDRPYGYQEEKWHWTYLPISKDITREAARTLSNDMITGFKGSEVASEVDMVQHFILGINKVCL